MALVMKGARAAALAGLALYGLTGCMSVAAGSSDQQPGAVPVGATDAVSKPGTGAGHASTVGGAHRTEHAGGASESASPGVTPPAVPPAVPGAVMVPVPPAAGQGGGDPAPSSRPGPEHPSTGGPSSGGVAPSADPSAHPAPSSTPEPPSPAPSVTPAPKPTPVSSGSSGPGPAPSAH